MMTYEIVYRAYYEDYPEVTITQTTPFLIEVLDPCGIESENTLIAQSIENKEYTISDEGLTIQIPSFSTSIVWCEVLYSVSVDDETLDPALDFDPLTNVVTIEYSDDLSLLQGQEEKEYQVSITG